ncbi:OmpA family protein [Paraprevotella sp.]|jgi:OOP family OmpA-OmpF porin|uniref:OmpA family protein n=1 Tax=Paraprevotella sp. TaxID=2049036 RepID=UPI00257D0D19|nr:OmpA family protein [Paraprevotella sp.]
MRKIRCMLAVMAMAIGTGVAYAGEGNSEKDYRPYPHMFFGLNGGAQVSFTHYDFSKLITPSYGVSFGAYFNPVIGARLHVSGYENKGGIKSLNETYDFNTVTGSADLLLNVTNMFRSDKDRVFNLILLGGVGLAGAWDNDDFHALAAKAAENYPMAWQDRRLSHNVRLGMQLDFNIAKHFGLNLELAANNRADRINSKTTDRNDWAATASLGLIFKFGQKKTEKMAEEPVPVAEEWATRTDTVWYDDITYRDVPEKVTYEDNIYYKIRLSEPEPASKIQKIADFVKAHKNCSVQVTAYADKATGTPELNMQYSKERAEKVVAALVKAGVSRSVITSEYKGDTVQPFAENDKNRVAIVKVTGEGVKKEQVKTKKYRLEETRYRVK